MFVLICNYDILIKIIFKIICLYRDIITKHNISIKSLEPIPNITLRNIHQKNNILIAQSDIGVNKQTEVSYENVIDNNKKYVNKNKMDYMVIKGNIYQNIYFLLYNSLYEYIIYIDNYIILNHDKNFRRIISQAGDVDLILAREKNSNNICLDIIIFRQSKWSLYKLKQLYRADIIDNSIILDQVYTSYIAMSFNKYKKYLDLGIPFKTQCITIYNELAFSSMCENINVKNEVYPWAPIIGYNEIISNNKIVPCLSENKIPKIIFQTMETSLLPLKILQSIEKWKELNPEYNYVYFSGLDCMTFIYKNFPAYVYNAYNKLMPGAYKADLWRYCILYIYGGVYTDIRTIPMIPLRKIIQRSDKFIISSDLLPFCLWNGFMCSSPRNFILKKTIEYVCNNINNNSYGDFLLDITGPLAIGKLLNRILFRPDNTFYTSDIKKYSIKILKFKNYYILYKNTPIINIKCNYSNKNFWLLTGKEHYGKAWWRKTVYKQSLF